jgi:nitroreductase
MSQNIFDVIHNHASVRSYKSDPVPEAVLEQILAAASKASTSGNMQAYSIIVTENGEIKKELYGPHFEQPMVLEAPLLLTFCADFNRKRKWLEQNDAPENFDNFMSFMIGAIDAILASQNAALAAEALGLGICYMGTTLASSDKIAKILKCPENVIPVVGFVLGYPNELISCRDRLPNAGIVHRETYRDYSVKEIEDIYAVKEVSGMKRYMDHPELRKSILENDIKNLAQVYTKVKYTQESHKEYSQSILKLLGEMNFMNNV